MPLRQSLRCLGRLLMPPVCIPCGAPGYGPDICRACRRDLAPNRPACPTCAMPWTRKDDAPCPHCEPSTLPWTAVFAAYRYRFPVSGLLTGLKYGGRLPNGRLLGTLLALELRRRRLRPTGAPLPDLLVPVPLHRTRERRRGFNQSVEIAQSAGQVLGIALDTRSCVRGRATAMQTTLDAAGRRDNVRGAFVAGSAVAGRRVAVVDDVMTTMATAGAVADALRDAGAGSIEVWVVARAPGPAPA